MIDETLEKKMRRASYLLPDPGGEVVRDALDAITILRSENDNLRAEVERHRAYAEQLRIKVADLEVAVAGHEGGDDE
jgi:hypothetical protein